MVSKEVLVEISQMAGIEKWKVSKNNSTMAFGVPTLYSPGTAPNHRQ